MEVFARSCGRLWRVGGLRSNSDACMCCQSQQLPSLTTFAQLRQATQLPAGSRWFSTGSQRLGSAPVAADHPSAEVKLSDNAVKRLRQVLETSAGENETALRLTVEAGGCSGFSYKFDLGPGPTNDDYIVDCGGQKLVIDSVSHEFVKGATVDFADELIKSTFEVVDNPNAGGKCGCGSSFTPKGL
ncbi:hypothetical protein WJX75_005069 [Coccomyxa subellipsoidea]|uniref:Core domain-containing protein n=1 Tax=Coccomyxa subellipsoidea TaxID=248742 RepID=A0ABR2Z3M4_9CHLO